MALRWVATVGENKITLTSALPTGIGAGRSNGSALDLYANDSIRLYQGGWSLTPSNLYASFNGIAPYIKGRLGINVTGPTANLHLPAGTALANTAPIKFTAGVVSATPSAGEIDYVSGSFIYQSDGMAIGSNSLHASALFSVTSTTKGVLIPRMTSTQRNAISSPATGLQVFATDDSSNYVYTGTTSGWRRIVHDGTMQRVGIGTTSANASSILDLTSTTGGFLPPRMTTAQRDAITSPASGLQVFNSTTGSTQHYDGYNWRNMGQDSGREVNAARLLGANTIAESYGCNALLCAQTAASSASNQAFYFPIYIPSAVTVTGGSFAAAANSSNTTQIALYKVDSDSLRLIDTTATFSQTLNTFGEANFTSQRTLTPGLYYLAAKSVSTNFLYRATATTANANFTTGRSSRSGAGLYMVKTSVTNFSTSYHFNELTRSTGLFYGALY